MLLFFEFDVVGFDFGVDALVVVIDGDGEDLLGVVLAHDVFVEALVDLLGREGVGAGCDVPSGAGHAVGGGFLRDDIAAQVDAFVADIDGAGPPRSDA